MLAIYLLLQVQNAASSSSVFSCGADEVAIGDGLETQTTSQFSSLPVYEVPLLVNGEREGPDSHRGGPTLAAGELPS